jgi:hypothetical protein
VAITGSSITYAGGGSNTYNGSAPAGGSAGSTSGAANTGAGGGGTISTGGLSGGSGVVILSVPTARYSGTTTGSPTVTTSGTKTIIKFTSSGTYTA